MATPPPVKRLSIDDFDEAPEWFSQFLDSYNMFASSVGQALQGGLDRDNLVGQLEEGVRVVTGASVAENVAPFPIIFKLRMSQRPRGLWVVNAINQASGSPVFSSAVMPSWDLTPDGRVRIRYLSGLSTNSKYLFSFRLE